MSIINFTDTLPVKPMRWVARLVSIPWGFCALFLACFAMADLWDAGNSLKIAVSVTALIVFALMTVGAAFIASVWGKETFGGWVLLADGVLTFAVIVTFVYVVGTPEEFVHSWTSGIFAIAFFAMSFPPMLAGTLFLASAHATAHSGAEAEDAIAEVAATKATAAESNRPEGRRAAMSKKIAISLLLVIPFVAFVFEVFFYPQPRIAPPQALVGTWEAEANLRVGRLPVRFTLHEDGRVEGTVGDAAMQDTYFRRNRGPLLRRIGWGTEYIVKGGLKGPLTGDFQCARFWIVGQFDEDGIRGDFDCSGCTKGGKKQGSLGTVVGAYTRVEER